MRCTSKVTVVAVFLSLAVALMADQQLFAADRSSPAAAKPAPRPMDATRQPGPILKLIGVQPERSPHPPAATMEKLRDLGAQLRRALDLAIDLFSNNEAELLSGNKTALLSGNKPKILSDNTTPIFSGNSFSLFSNIKIEIHISNSGNSAAGGAAAQPPVGPRPKTTR